MKTVLDRVNFEKLNGLVPVITTDAGTKKVLMLGFMDKEALEKTTETKEMYYYSRSRNKLWKKGEQSGNIQKLISLKLDCDGDSLLAEVEQKGVVCHEGGKSCFFNEVIAGTVNKEGGDILEELTGVIRARRINPKKDSYVCKLLDGQVDVKKKILEEAKELIEAEKREDIVWEAADLMFFILVYLEKNNIEYTKVLEKLRKRRR